MLQVNTQKQQINNKTQIVTKGTSRIYENCDLLDSKGYAILTASYVILPAMLLAGLFA
jgi:hypothetical protein